MTAFTAPVAARIDERERVLGAFLDREQDRIARVCHDLACAFSRGGVLVPYGVGAAATDAAHVAVEFMHPVIVGKRALPALAPSNDPARTAGPAAMVRGDDIALAITHGPAADELRAFLAEASRRGALTVALAGRGGERPDADHVLVVDSDDPEIVQEVQETTYHVLWELVHVFFEHPGLLEERCVTCGDVAVEATVVAVAGPTVTVERGGAREEVAAELVEGVAIGDVLLCHAGVALEKVPGSRGGAGAGGEREATAFLYPFLERDEHDLDGVLAEVRASTVRKGEDVIALRRAIDLGALERAAADVRARLDRGGRLLAFGNGGSATDAQDLAADALARGRPAAALTNDAATVTAVANDIGYDNVFARQLIALGRSADVAVAITTSGSSRNVVVALEEAHRRGLLTVALTGYDGGRLAELDWLDHLFIVRSDYVPRLQEAHATISHLLLEAVG